MHLRLSNQELATLVEMLSLASYIASWNEKEESSDQVAAFEALEHKILEKAGQNGLAHWIEFDEESQRFKLRPEIEESLFFNECYEEFRNESFWNELAIRLSDRDLVRAIGFQAWSQLTEEERRARTTNWEKAYWDEFTRHGIDRMVIMRPPGEG